MVVGQADEAFHLLTGIVHNRDYMLDWLLTEIGQKHLTQRLAA